MITIGRDKSITITRGDSLALTFKTTNYDLIDGDKVTFSVAKTYEDEEPTITKEITSINEQNHSVNIQLSPSETEIPTGIYVYDIQVDLHDGRRETVVTSRLIVKGEVTKPWQT